MTLAEFEAQVFERASTSRICDIPVVRRATATAINIRIGLTLGGFIDAFYNEVTETTAYAWILDDQRVFGIDNTGGWHVHPFGNPDVHVELTGAITFDEFVDSLERQESHHDSDERC